MKTKKLLSIILAVLMIAATVPVAFAADDISSGMYSQYQFFEEGIENECYIVNFLNTTYDGLGLKDFELVWTIIEGELPEGLELVTTERELKVKGTSTDMGSHYITVELTATGKDGTVYTAQKKCEIEVVEQFFETKAANFFADLAPEVSMSDAATVDEVLAWANNTWLPSLEGLAELEAEAESEFHIIASYEYSEIEYTAPIAGDKNDPDGTDGYLKAYVVYNSEEYPLLAATVEIAIKSTPWAGADIDHDNADNTDNTDDTDDGFRCGFCDRYEAIIAHPDIIEFVKTIVAAVHLLVHSIQYINYLT